CRACAASQQPADDRADSCAPADLPRRALPFAMTLQLDVARGYGVTAIPDVKGQHPQCDAVSSFHVRGLLNVHRLQSRQRSAWDDDVTTNVHQRIVNDSPEPHTDVG